jgi:shikimate dehydrogenase
MEMNIVSAKTRIFVIVGDPVTQSMSPIIMNNAFKRYGLDNAMVAFRCDIAHFNVVMEAFRSLDVAGYVITMPFKETVVAYLDELRDEARLSGSVNCIQNNNGKLIGYNTDSKGFWGAIREKNRGIDAIQVKKLFLLGMGGLAKAVATEAALQGVREIAVANLTEELSRIEGFKVFAKNLHSEILDITIKVLPWIPDEWRADLADTDVVMNATSIGMIEGGTLCDVFPYESVPQRTFFFDAPVANPRTDFLIKAESLGHRIFTGVDLNVNQGVHAFNIMTGYTAKLEDMRCDALNYLHERCSRDPNR